MIKRTIEISRQAVHLSVRHDQLVIQPIGETKAAATIIPCEDIGVVCIDHPGTSYSHQAMTTLIRSGAAVVMCGADHLPAGMLLPLSNHTEVLWRINDQITVTEPRKKRLWQQIVTAKIGRQARNLPEEASTRRFLEELTRTVRSGDKGNAESQAARVYWSAWLDPLGGSRLISSVTAGSGEVEPGADEWHRNQDGLDPLNVMLNYGYAVLRAAVARALVSAGLFPAIAVFHHNRSNAFALADDLVEPFRPLVDARVRELYRLDRGIHDGLDQPTKAALLELLTHPVLTDGASGPLMISLHRMTASFVRCLRGEESKLLLPDWTQVLSCK